MIVIKINYAAASPIVNVNYDVSPIYVRVMYGGAGDSITEWGEITGTLSNQTDLQNALNAKQNTLTLTTTGTSGASTLVGSTLNIPNYQVSGFVPYTGATANVDLGEYELKSGQLTLDVSPTGTASVGTTRWNNTIGSSETTLKGGSVLLKNGVDLVARVVNKVSPNTTLTKAAYQAVRISGAQGQRLAVAYAQANNDANSADTIGLVTETIATNQEGFIMTVGSIEGINTTGSLQGETWTDGDVLYLSPTVAGAITNIKPIAPQHLVIIGYVEYAHANNGKIYVKVMNGWELGELHDVNTSGATNGQVLTYNGSIWVPSTNGVGTVTSVAALTLGTSGTDLSSSVANGTTTPVITLNVPTASAANRGVLSSTDWTTFNNKQNALTNPITGTGTSGQIAYWNGTNTQTGSATLTYTPTSSLLVNNSVTAASLIARGTNLTPTLVASANNDVLVGLDINPTFTNGAFTGVTNYSLRVGGSSISQIAGRLDLPGSIAGNTLTFTGNAQKIGLNNATFNNSNTTYIATFSGNSITDLSIKPNGLGTASSVVTFNAFSVNASVGRIGVDSTSSYIQSTISGTGTQLPLDIKLSSTTYGRFFATTGNLALQNGGTFTDGGQRLQVTGTSYFSDSVQIGVNSIGTNTLRVGKNITGATTLNSVLVDGAVQSDVTGDISYIVAQTRTAAATFNVTNSFLFRAAQASIGASSTIGTQVGFYAEPSLTGATNNYGFLGGIASGTNRWNLYMDGTANNYMAGSLGIGSTSLTGINLKVNKNLTGATSSYSIDNTSAILSDVTSTGIYYNTYANTQSANFSLSNIVHYQAGGISTFANVTAGGAVTNQTGFLVLASTIGATNNYGFRGLIPSGTNRWNIYMDGTASNYLEGDTAIGTTSLGTATKFTLGGSETAVSAIARGQLINTTLTASANNDVLVGLDVNPTLSAGAFTGVTNAGLRIIFSGTGTGVGNYLSIINNTYPVINSGGAISINAQNTTVFYADTVQTEIKARSVTSIITFSLSNTIVGRFFGTTGNLLLQNGGTFTDAGYRLDVNGTARVQGNGLFTGSLSVISSSGLFYLNRSVDTNANAIVLKTSSTFDWFIGQSPLGNAISDLSFYSYGTSSEVLKIAKSTGAATFISSLTAADYRLSALNTAPATSSSTGTLGEIRIDANHIYVCTATNTWKRVAIATF